MQTYMFSVIIYVFACVRYILSGCSWIGKIVQIEIDDEAADLRERVVLHVDFATSPDWVCVPQEMELVEAAPKPAADDDPALAGLLPEDTPLGQATLARVDAEDFGLNIDLKVYQKQVKKKKTCLASGNAEHVEISITSFSCLC